MLLDPDLDPHSQYRSGSRTANSMRTRINNTVFLYFAFLKNFFPCTKKISKSIFSEEIRLQNYFRNLEQPTVFVLIIGHSLDPWIGNPQLWCFLSPYCKTNSFFKGNVSWDRFQKFWQKCTELGLTKGRGWFLKFLGGSVDFVMQKVYLFWWVLVWVGLIMVSCLFLSVHPITSGV